ncbi:rhodanese-like domain-containing protein [Mesonia sediminis]|uniref:Rhodanese-like domain-containing protein n=1 Tax=Mesonia sediminis TaxID=1703946 RepID=A0ABW5S9Q9_9FLAO
MTKKEMGILNLLFGNKSKMIQDFKSRGAIIIDVRSAGEYANGAIPGSKNIPLQQIGQHIQKIKNYNKPIITCCASGMRSGSAAGILKSKGIECINGGGWHKLYTLLNS